MHNRLQVISVVLRGDRAAIVLCLCVLGCLADVSEAKFLSARDAHSAPRGRIACLPSSTLGTRYPDPDALGPHTYGFSLSERNGIVYTCSGGHIDVTHARKVADWTAYLAYKTREALTEDQDAFTFRMREPSVYHVSIKYPKGWKYLPRRTKEEIARDLSIGVGQYFAYTGSTWHEILTWFGFKSVGVYSEYLSAFSWEDNYSNVLGSHIGAAALRDPDHEYNDAVTLALDSELKRLGVQPRPAARQAGELVRGLWFTGDFVYCDMIKRHFDTGLDDGFVTPWLAPGLPGCDGAVPQACPVPSIAFIEEYGFSIRLEIEPKEWEKDQILQIIYPQGVEGQKRIEPAVHFGPIIDYIRAQAVERYGPQVDDCYARARRTRPSVAPEDTGARDALLAASAE